jgi:hypothetical protein
MAATGIMKSSPTAWWSRRGAVSLAARYAWALPATAVGVLAASGACIRGRIRIVGGVVEAHGPVLDWCLSTLVPIEGGAAAITFGHVVVGRDAEALDATRAHERVHVAQYERWGVFFLPAYGAASLWAMTRGGHYYRDNWFERAAREGEAAAIRERATGRQQSSRSAFAR